MTDHRPSPNHLLATILAACALTACYDIKDVGDLPGGTSFSEAYALNEVGEVVGYGTTAQTNAAFIWSTAGGIRALPMLATATSCVAHGINDGGLVVGVCTLGAAATRAAVYWRGGQVQAINFYGGASLGSEALAVSQDGFVSGTQREIVGRHVIDTAFMWDSNSAFATPMGVNPLPADVDGSGVGAAVARNGWVAGNAFVNRGNGMHQAYLWNPGSQRTAAIDHIPTLPPDAAGEARGINDARQVVGVADGKGFLFTPGPNQTVGTVTLLNFEPYDINNKGQIVGIRMDTSSGSARQVAVVYDVASGSLSDLESQIPNFAGSGWRTLDLALAINDKGQIAGRGLRTNGDTHGFLMTPL